MVVTKRRCLVALISVSLVCLPLTAAVLPENRADVLYHYYSGGGVEIQGPSVLLRSQVGNSVSVSANYYVDSISSASIDVVTAASAYQEEREEKSFGIDYVKENVTLGAAYTMSTENDFDAESLHFSIAQDMFGDMTTVSLGYSLGADVVGKTISRTDGKGRIRDPDFEEQVDRQNYRLGISQILSRNLIIGFNFETVTDEGYLNNPYRSVRYLASTGSYARQTEKYPNTRTSRAASLRFAYYLPYRAALHGEYRLFSDTWGINAENYQLGYTHPLDKHWVFDFSLRFYSQTQADFYSDLFSRESAQTFFARDKELSTYTNRTLGLGASYEFTQTHWTWFDKGSLNVSYRYITFDYDNFRDLRVKNVAPGEEPLYGFSANVLQVYLSIWY